MLAISRFRYDGQQPNTAHGELAGALEALASCPGYRTGSVGRALDDPELWVLHTTWDGVGPYRRAMSSYSVRLAMRDLMARVIDEPSAFEVLIGEGRTDPNEAQPRGSLP